MLRGSLSLYGAGQIDEAKNSLALISSEDNFKKTLKGTVRAHFNHDKLGTEQLVVTRR